MSQLARQIVDAIISGGHDKANAMFETAMATTIKHQVADYKVVVAQHMFEGTDASGAYMPEKRKFTLDVIHGETGEPFRYNEMAYTPQESIRKAKEDGHAVTKITDEVGNDVTNSNKQISEACCSAPQKHIDLAYSWHGGQSSPLYSFASTGGVVHNEQHRTNLNKEIDTNIASATQYENDPKYNKEYKGQTKKLNALKKYINSAPTKELAEGMRIVSKHGDGKHTAKVYKDTEWGEHRVKFFVDGKHQPDEDYHTDDVQDAKDTADAALKFKNSEHINEDIDSAFSDWKSQVATKFPQHANNLRYVTKPDAPNQISAQVKGKDQTCGVFDMKSAKGEVLSEGTETGAVDVELTNQRREQKEQEDAERARQAEQAKAPTIQDVMSVLGNTTSVADTGVAK